MSTAFDRDRIRSFARARFADKLEVLELQYCSLDEGAWEELLSEGAFPNLKRLCLAGADYDEAEKERVRERFGPEALDLEHEFPERPWYHSWWDK
jgi:hypothetical protein